MHRLLPIATLALACGLSGCRNLDYLFHLGAPIQTTTVEAECDELANHSVAIVVFADQKVLYEHADAPLTLSAVIGAKLEEHVEKVSLIDPRRIVRYQRENVHWDSIDRTKLGKAFNVQYVLFVTLVEYTTREPGAMNLFRGRITADAAVYQTSLPENKARRWHAQGLRTVFPETEPGKVGDNDRRIRRETELRFAEMLARRFYKHKVTESP